MSCESIYEDGTYLAGNRTWHAEDSAWKASHVGRMLDRNRIHPGTLCEVGCGAGEILKCLADRYGSDVVLSGYEISPQAFAICARKEMPNIHFFHGSVQDEKEASFDVLMALDVVEHVEDYIGFLRSLRTKAEYKIFHIPLDLSVQTVLRTTPIGAVRKKYGHIHYFTKDSALETLKAAGYQVRDHFYTAGNLELPNLDWKKRLMKYPRKLSFAFHQDLTVRILGGFSLMVLAQ